MTARLALAAAACLVLAGCAGGEGPRDRRAAYLGQSAQPSEIIAAELKFARMAREKGTWTAFRETATDDAVWPGPQWQNVKAAIKGWPDPAQPIVWEPDSVWMSCDGSYAIATGPGTYPTGRRTRYVTVWQRQADGGYKWVLDQGFDLETGYAKPEMIATAVADCQDRRPGKAAPVRRGEAWQSAASDDGSLRWRTSTTVSCVHTLVVELRQAGAMREVFRQTSAVPPPTKDAAPQSCLAT